MENFTTELYFIQKLKNQINSNWCYWYEIGKLFPRVNYWTFKNIQFGVCLKKLLISKFS